MIVLIFLHIAFRCFTSMLTPDFGRGRPEAQFLVWMRYVKLLGLLNSTYIIPLLSVRSGIETQPTIR